MHVCVCVCVVGMVHAKHTTFQCHRPPENETLYMYNYMLFITSACTCLLRSLNSISLVVILEVQCIVRANIDK